MGTAKLFLIRGKLGDSLVFHAALQTYLELHPNTNAFLAIRKPYAPLIQGDSSAKLIPFNSRIELLARILWLRLRGTRFSCFATLWGFGPVVERVAKICGAGRKLYIDDRYPQSFTEWPEKREYKQCTDAGWYVLKRLDKTLPAVERLSLPALRASNAATRDKVVIVPVADEPRRCLNASACSNLVSYVKARHPEKEIFILLNPNDAGTATLKDAQLPDKVSIRHFHQLQELLEILGECSHWYGTDTGLYHLAAGLGLKAFVLFGPSQPKKVILPKQDNAGWARLSVLVNEHCEVTNCSAPECLNLLSQGMLTPLAHAAPLLHAPSNCPLREHPIEMLGKITIENPDR